MIPGGAHPFLRAGGGHWKSHYKIGHSVRVRRAATAYLSRVFAVPTNNLKWTLSFWVRRAAVGVEDRFFGASDGTTNNTSFIGFDASDRLRFYNRAGGVTNADLLSIPYYRDPGAHRHVVIVYDAANATAANRVKMYVNGDPVGYTNGPLPLNAASELNVSGRTVQIGANTINSIYSDGNISEVIFVDGQDLVPTIFGRICPEKGHWEPIKFIGTYGNNGTYPDFSDGSAATSATLGKDRSGNNNDWTPNNISVAAGVTCDWLTDTPTNRYATLNPVAPNATYPIGILQSGNLEAVATASNNEVQATMAVASGKWYFEFSFTTNATRVGIATGGAGRSAIGTKGVLYEPSTGNKLIDGGSAAYGATFTSGDVIGVALDADANQVTFYKNNVSQGAIGFTPADFISPSIFTPNSIALTAYFNAGQRPFSYTPPAGFRTLCAANEPEPIVVKSTAAFSAAVDSGANIQATLAARSAGWGAYIELFKRREAAEGWCWRFSDDAANYLDSSSTAAKAAFPTLSGTAYVGYALKVAAANGVATGTFAHVNGVADTITDGLGNSRKLVILKRESAAGDNWYVFHPDLTSGKLLYLNTNGAETVDASIGSVLSNSFVAAAALPSGTYRWIALAEVRGLIKLGKRTGNGVADGPFSNNGFLSALSINKRTDAASGFWGVLDNARGAYNPMGSSGVSSALLALDTSGAESSYTGAYEQDFVACGVKLRMTSAAPSYNASGGVFVTIDIAAFPSRYANAR